MVEKSNERLSGSGGNVDGERWSKAISGELLLQRKGHSRC